MNNVAKKLAVALLLSIPACMYASVTTGQSFYLPHAQTGTMANLLGWNNQINLFGNDELSIVFKAQTEAGMSFRNDKLAPYFTSNGTKTMVFGPAHTSTTNLDTDVFGLNFLLSKTLKSSVVFNPKTTNWSTNFGLFADLSNWVEGLHVRFNLPLQYIKNEMELTETNSVAGGAAYVAGDVITGATPAVAYTTVVNAFKGNLTVGDVLSVWNYGRINGAQHDTQVSDITASIGYNFVNSENGHLGVEVGGLFGAGKKSKADYVFEPIFGTAGRHSVFGAVDAHAVVWSGDEDKQLSAFLNGNVGYIFAGNQKRSYDLTTSGDWSRYLLVKKITTISTTTNTVYGGLDNMINIGSLTAKIGDYIQYDASLLFDMQYNNFNFQVGYELAGRGKEKHKSFVDTIAANTWIIYDNTGANIDSAIAVADAGTLSAKGANFLPISGDTTSNTITETVTGTTSHMLSNSSLDTTSVLAPSVMSHSVVGGINYTWRDNDWAPCLGLFGKAEFSGTDNNTADLYAVGVQGNVSF